MLCSTVNDAIADVCVYILPDGGSGAEGSKSWRDGLMYNDTRI